MQNILVITQILLSILLIVFIILQNQGSGLSEVFGGSDSFYTSKRGFEKVLFIGTIVTAALFFLNSIAFILV